MPAEKLPSEQPTRSKAASAYSIVGMYSDPADAQFVRHVAILAEDSELKWGEPATVQHMGPPLVADERPVHLFGNVPLDLDDGEGIRDWLEEERKDPPPNPFKSYVVRPHCDWHTAPETGRRLYRRFSCVGFVLECYRSIGVDLVNTEERNLPDVDFDMLLKAYPSLAREGAMERAMGGLTRDDLGIAGDGPWRLVLAGYVFHALNEITDDDPRPGAYTPTSVAKAYFPRQGL